MADPTSPTITLEEMLARLRAIPKARNFITTPELQHATGDVHVTTVYRWVQWGWLKAHRVNSRGRMSLYARGDVETFMRSRFEPVLATPKGTRGANGQPASPAKRGAGGRK